MKTHLRIVLIIILATLLNLKIKSQQVNNLYFLENSPIRHYLNPAFQPLSNLYIGLPTIGYSMIGVGNNSFTISSLHTNKDQVYRNLKPITTVSNQNQISLINFGFRHNEAYWSVGISTKFDVYAGLPKDLIKLLMYGNATIIDGDPIYDKTNFNLQSFKMGSSAYTELALGYSRIINEKWNVGVKLKYLHGLGNVNAQFDDFDLTTSLDEWTIKAKGIIQASSPYDIVVGDNLGSLDIYEPSNFLDFVRPSGTGAAIDLGITYKPANYITLGAAITDLGFINWRRKTNHISLTTDYAFDGASLNSSTIFDKIDTEALVDSILNALEESAITSNYQKNYSTITYPKLNASVEVNLIKQTISVAVLSTTAMQNKTWYQDLTTALNVRPTNWFNMSLSYSILNGKTSNLGAGIGLRIGFVNAFFTTDFIPLKYSNIPLSAFDIEPVKKPIPPFINKAGDKARLPYKSDRFNFAIGINFVIGNSSDKDKDGVRDKRDKCPDTPSGIKVDKQGCPFDTDKDGIFDFKDKCPNTPKEAFGTVDASGCPIDTDGDGVFDFKDKCNNTPLAAIGMVDSLGCPLDADSDGVGDFLDECPSTPLGHMVDSVGCSVDTDKDGVPDFNDKCPDTPADAIGLIDSLGCPIDSDLDGVSDFKDQCPNTPVEERALVDSVGCTKDTDGDGIYDYQDKCPEQAGSASNLGCPDVAPELENLFNNALQSIQFQTGKATLLPTSYLILDQIAKHLIDTNNLKIEIQGHTDNIGNAEANQRLSEGRAKAVRNYLISKGVSTNKISAVGYGDSKPLVPNNSSSNKSKNRRVEFRTNTVEYQ